MSAAMPFSSYLFPLLTYAGAGEPLMPECRPLLGHDVYITAADVMCKFELAAAQRRSPPSPTMHGGMPVLYRGLSAPPVA